MLDAPLNGSPRDADSAPGPAPYSEHLVPRGNFAIYARHYAGTGPAFVFMHGFPDTLRLYDRLAPLLRGRQIITFDFLGWGASEKPEQYAYTSNQQEQDLQAVLDALHVDQVVPVAHDSSGPVAINWALDHPGRVSALVLLNTYYGSTPTLRFPEWLSLFADPAYAALTDAITHDPKAAEWLLRWQGTQFNPRTTDAVGGPMDAPSALWQLVWPQFAATPSAFPAVISLARDLHATLQANTQRLPNLQAFDRPVRIIFGAGDPYLNPGVARSLHEAFPASELTLLQKGHWPQLDGAPEVAQLLLALPEAMHT